MSVFCAIYTRKSTSEGLEQEFSSLDAQRESALSYIASQKSHGWLALPGNYDDGGYTGANMERPALKQLLQDIEDGKVNCVVVYKVDRLSRSLTDFAKLLEFFDKHNVTFVSVTQHFNTQSSMGRLTLNILLSFAQFEREIISERTRDKIGAARKQGRWIGGLPMLGYDVNAQNKTLIINPAEADQVRELFDLYLKHQSLWKVAQVLNSWGICTKKHVLKSGRVFGGKPFRKQDVAAVLNNCVCAGKVRYAGELYDGQHEGIVPFALFEQAQRLLGANRVRRSSRGNKSDASLLRHILWCGSCNRRMLPTYSSKKNIKYRYYVCENAHQNGYGACQTKSVSARELESLVEEKLRLVIQTESSLRAKRLVINTPAWEVLFPQERRRVINQLLKAVRYDSKNEKLELELNTEGIVSLQEELCG